MSLKEVQTALDDLFCLGYLWGKISFEWRNLKPELSSPRVCLGKTLLFFQQMFINTCSGPGLVFRTLKGTDRGRDT